MGRIIEGLWDCEYCRTKGIGGSKRECPNCGHARDESTVFYLPQKKVYVPEETAQKVSKEPDWLCVYCGGSLNPDDAEYCLSCGAKRTSENLNYFENQESHNLQKNSNNNQNNSDYGNTTVSEDNETESNALQEILSQSSGVQSVTTKLKNLILKNKVKIIAIVAVLLVLLGIVYLLIPKEKQITINQVGWSRSIAIEQYKTVKESDWSLPAQARLLYQKEEIHSYQQVLDHYETRTRTVEKQRLVGYDERVVGMRDLGNGYFEEITEQVPVYETYYEEETYEQPIYESIPVYKTKYYYEIDKWLYERSVITKGNDKTPYWGEVVLKEKEREGTHNEEYYIIGKDSKGKSYEVGVSYQQWEVVNIGDNVKVKIYITGNGKIVE